MNDEETVAPDCLRVATTVGKTHGNGSAISWAGPGGR